MQGDIFARKLLTAVGPSLSTVRLQLSAASCVSTNLWIMQNLNMAIKKLVMQTPTFKKNPKTLQYWWRRTHEVVFPDV